MGLIVRLVVVAFIVLAIMGLLRAGIRRVWPIGNQHSFPRRTRVLNSLDRGVAMTRRFAFWGAAFVIFVIGVQMVIRHPGGTNAEEGASRSTQSR